MKIESLFSYIKFCILISWLGRLSYVARQFCDELYVYTCIRVNVASFKLTLGLLLFIFFVVGLGGHNLVKVVAELLHVLLVVLNIL